MEYNQEYIQGLFFEKIAGTISEQDNLVAEQAILNDAGLRKFWEELKTKMEKPQGRAFLSGLDADRAWAVTRQNLHRAPVSFFRRNKWILSAAAVLVIALPLAWYIGFSGRHPLAGQQQAFKEVYLKTQQGKAVDLSGNQQITLGETQIQTKQQELSYTSGAAQSKEWATLFVPATKDYKIKLSDGTTVWMNAASSLRFPFQFGKETRAVYLTGEAYFEVAKNSLQAFVVHTSTADIQVHGTSFNVNAYTTAHFTTALVEGAVSVKKKAQQIRLKPGEEVLMSSTGFEVRPFDAQEVLSWRNGTYSFHNQPLSQIAEVLKRWFDVQIVWQSSGVSQQTFTGEIDKHLPLEVVISNLKLSSGMQAELKNRVLTFK
ncbi:FecR family protein [Pedobacter nutrimenti]|uniref:FecR family protein n=1 Tax=Pedobacter nutrimenti TaxID=1241337 RepID=A0A318U8H2_9SPHI|nr:FecR family protein [Pedobacter nutrimenti]PYF69491.1 FecR family protein [Pedobacter nutrimenti]